MNLHPTQRQGFTLIELLVVIAIISIIAGLLVPTLLKGRGEAYKVQCGSNLKQIYTFAMTYSDSNEGNRAFPFAGGQNPRAHESLNKLVEFDSEALDPKLFICPEGGETAAVKDEKGKFILDETTLSYAWVAKRTKNTALNKSLASDKYFEGYEDQDGKHDGHLEGLQILMTDNRVEFLRKQELPQENMLPDGLTR